MMVTTHSIEQDATIRALKREIKDLKDVLREAGLDVPKKGTATVPHINASATVKELREEYKRLVMEINHYVPVTCNYMPRGSVDYRCRIAKRLLKLGQRLGYGSGYGSMGRAYYCDKLKGGGYSIKPTGVITTATERLLDKIGVRGPTRRATYGHFRAPAPTETHWLIKPPRTPKGDEL